MDWAFCVEFSQHWCVSLVNFLFVWHLLSCHYVSPLLFYFLLVLLYFLFASLHTSLHCSKLLKEKTQCHMVIIIFLYTVLVNACLQWYVVYIYNVLASWRLHVLYASLKYILNCLSHFQLVLYLLNWGSVALLSAVILYYASLTQSLSRYLALSCFLIVKCIFSKSITCKKTIGGSWWLGMQARVPLFPGCYSFVEEHQQKSLMYTA